MDSLDHMLTDPLELGPCGDGHGTRIMEDCLLGGTRVSLPEDLLEDVSSDSGTIFFFLAVPLSLFHALQVFSLLCSLLSDFLHCNQSDLFLFLSLSLFNSLIKEESISYILHV